MNADRLLALYEKVAEAPDAIARLRRFVLNLAVRGKLVAQDAGDEPSSELLKRIAAEKARLMTAGDIRKPKPLAPIEAEELPFGLPRGWAWARLGTLIDLISGQHLQPPEYTEDPTAGLPYITGPSDFGVEGLIIRRYALVRKAVATRGQLLLTVKGSGIGKATICKLEEVAISRQLMALTAVSWDPNFLELVADRLATKLQEEARSLIPGISREDVTDFVLALPPLAEQRRIVAKVEELMALLDRLEAARTARETARDRLTAASLVRLTAPDADPAEFPANARFILATLPALTSRPDQIKPFRQTILNLAVRGKLVAQDPTEGIPKRYSDRADFDWLPQTWRALNFGEHCDIEGGNQPPKSQFVDEPRPGYVRLLQIRDLGEKPVPVYIPEGSTNRFCREGEILIGRYGASVGKIFWAQDGAYNVALTKFVWPTDAFTADFAFILLKSDLFQERLSGASRSAQAGFNKGDLRDIDLPLPPLAEQHRIVAKVDALMALCDRLEAALTTADTTRARLLEALLHEALEPAARAMEAAE